MRAGETISLPDITLDMTAYDIKSQYAQKTGLSPDKIKLLLNKKPTGDLKTLKDLGVESNVDFSVMIMGVAGTTPRAQSPATVVKQPAPVAAPPADAMDIDEKTSAPESERAAAEVEHDPSADSTTATLQSDEFWLDLKGFLTQRLRDEKQGEELVGLFRGAYSKR
jgi:hypothetical protein